jgi:hypothetical protein
MSDQRESDESAEPTEANDPIESSEQADPIEPIESAEPTLPIERIEPLDPIESNELSDQRDHRESRVRFDMTPVSPRARRRASAELYPGLRASRRTGPRGGSRDRR